MVVEIEETQKGINDNLSEDFSLVITRAHIK